MIFLRTRSTLDFLLNKYFTRKINIYVNQFPHYLIRKQKQNQLNKQAKN